MSFTVNIHSILQSNNYPIIERGKQYSFSQQAKSTYADNMPVWLIRNDWEAQAEISIMSQTFENDILTGAFRIDYVYEPVEQQLISTMLIRMYAGIHDPYIYLLSSNKEYTKALNKGFLSRDSIQEEGFIHGSPKSQLTRLANKYYKQTQEPLILSVDKSKVTAVIKWEPATGGLYPHIYGELNANAIVEATPIALNENGEYLL